jgi:hypothetical protein
MPSTKRAFDKAAASRTGAGSSSTLVANLAFRTRRASATAETRRRVFPLETVLGEVTADALGGVWVRRFGQGA